MVSILVRRMYATTHVASIWAVSEKPYAWMRAAYTLCRMFAHTSPILWTSFSEATEEYRRGFVVVFVEYGCVRRPAGLLDT